MQNLEVKDLDEIYGMELPVLYTREEIPVSQNDIPSQEDVDRWPHLNGVYLPTVNAEIGLLIASDVPEALDPLEVKNSQHGGPCATRTRLGSMVLQSAIDGVCVQPVFSLKVTFELRQMIVTSGSPLLIATLSCLKRSAASWNM